MTRLKRLSLMLAAALMVTAVSARASANELDGYVCEVTDFALPTVNGPSGIVTVQLTSAPSCGGTNVGFAFFAGSGGTTCASQATFSEARLLRFFDLLAAAMKDHRNVRVSIYPIGKNCATSVTYRDTPPPR